MLATGATLWLMWRRRSQGPVRPDNEVDASIAPSVVAGKAERT
jgi:hypothetical protein